MSEEIKEVKEEKKAQARPPRPEKVEKAAKPAEKTGGEAPAPAEGAAPAAGAVVPRKKKVKKNVSTGVVHIQATFNNTIITVTDTNGSVLSWCTSGSKGFKGSKKGTPFAAQLASETACKKALEHGLKSVVVYVRGPGAGRESALRAISHAGIRVTAIRDLTPIPHNGCRPPKRRRI
jgi:small subunit ribosomal protein S11